VTHVKRALALLLVAGTAHAGGTARPNGISPRGVGMGGAWTAWADDVAAIWFNPGALDAVEPQVVVGTELVIGPRTYTPIAADGTKGDAQSTTIVAPAPTLGVVGRFSDDDQPSRFTFGVGAWNTFGGQVSYEKTGMSALDTTQDICFELNAAAALHVSDRLSVGATARLGVGIFHIESTAMPFDADLSANGVGFGLGVGALFRPTDNVRVGVTWRSPLRITTRGSGSIVAGTTPQQYDITHDQDWPQQASLGVGWQVAPRWKLATQLDWAEWSQIDTIEVNFPAHDLPDQVFPEYWKDNWTARLGGEFAASPRWQVRAGGYFDTQAVPDATLERQYADAPKFGVSVGTSVHAGMWRIDFAADGLIPRTHTVPNNTDAVAGVPALANKAPGDYLGGLVTFELAAARRF
jgi:long-chain fatty acid transport protein